MILGGSGSKLVPKTVTTTYEHQRERFEQICIMKTSRVIN